MCVCLCAHECVCVWVGVWVWVGRVGVGVGGWVWVWLDVGAVLVVACQYYTPLQYCTGSTGRSQEKFGRNEIT